MLAIKSVIPITIILIVLLTSVTIKKGGLIISQRAEIDGYYFIGGMEAFVAGYENPYQDKRHYLEFETIDERPLDVEEYVNPHLDDTKTCWDLFWVNKNDYKDVNPEGFEWYYDTNLETYIIETYERKLEGFYYLDLFEPEEYEDSNQHKVELARLEEVNDGRSYRAVLSSEKYEDMVFRYELSSHVEFQPAEFYAYYGAERPREIERYDILVQGKEIPAYFLGMVDAFHVVKVEPYLHYWSENGFKSRKDTLAYVGKLRTMRQY